MVVGVVLRLDEASARQVAALTKALPDRHSDRNPPHITLASYDDGTDTARLDEALAEVVSSWTTVSVTLDGIAMFPGEPCELALLPIPITELIRRHIAVDEALTPVADRHCYERGIWSPSLSIGSTDYPADCIEVLTARWGGPIEATLDRIDIVRLLPFEVISIRSLAG